MTTSQRWKQRMRRPARLHAVDWIVSYGCRRRQISAGQLRQLLNRQKGCCTWCGIEVPKGRRTWCSQKCVGEFNLRCDPASARWAVEERDKGVCAECGFDSGKLQRIRSAVQRDDWYYGHKLPELIGFGSVGHFWEMDHIIPVSEGGGLCSLHNLRTLCIPCHHVASAELAGRRAADNG